MASGDEHLAIHYFIDEAGDPILFDRRGTKILVGNVPEVRREVFSLLLKHDIKFYAVIRNKTDLVSYVQQQNERDPAYRYRENGLYDTLTRQLSNRFQFAKPLPTSEVDGPIVIDYCTLIPTAESHRMEGAAVEHTAPGLVPGLSQGLDGFCATPLTHQSSTD